VLLLLILNEVRIVKPRKSTVTLTLISIWVFPLCNTG
jgi:hypothetical protein